MNVALPDSISEQMTYSEERRRFQRVRVNLIGRYMLPDQREFACQVREMSPGGASMIAPEAAPEGSRVIAYLDHVGRIEGRITRAFHGGFAMTIDAGRRKRDKLASQLTWLANRDSLGLPEDRRHDRYVPDDTQSEIRLPDGRVFPCDVIDMSLSGAAVSCLIRPEIGTIVEVGPETGKVVRHFDGGFAIEFSNAHRNILVG